MGSASDIDLARLPAWLNVTYRKGFIRGFCRDYRRNGNRLYRAAYAEGLELREYCDRG